MGETERKKEWDRDKGRMYWRQKKKHKYIYGEDFLKEEDSGASDRSWNW